MLKKATFQKDFSVKPKSKITNERQELIKEFIENTYITSKESEYVHPDAIVIGVQVKDWSTNDLRDFLKECKQAKNFSSFFWYKIKEHRAQQKIKQTQQSLTSKIKSKLIKSKKQAIISNS